MATRLSHCCTMPNYPLDSCRRSRVNDAPLEVSSITMLVALLSTSMTAVYRTIAEMQG
jgi:hypothetical protein